MLDTPPAAAFEDDELGLAFGRACPEADAGEGWEAAVDFDEPDEEDWWDEVELELAPLWLECRELDEDLKN
jgi:hypothetical protein